MRRRENGYLRGYVKGKTAHLEGRLTTPATHYLVSKVLGTIHANNKSDEVCTHHHQNIEDTTNSTAVAIPPFFAKLCMETEMIKSK